jgi:hypothetical protein
MNLRNHFFKDIHSPLILAAGVLLLFSFLSLGENSPVPFPVMDLEFSAPIICWTFAFLLLLLWLFYRKGPSMLFSQMLTGLQVWTTIVPAVLYCSVNWWGSIFPHPRRYVDVSAFKWPNSFQLLDQILEAILVILLISILLFVLNMAFGLFRIIKVKTRKY